MPTFHFGRMVDHVHLRVRDVEASRRFYLGALASLGLEPGMQGDGYFQIDELFVSGDGPPTANLHLAFQTTSREEVDRWHEAALAAGGRDNGAPGLRPQYHANYYAAFVHDPDGINVEAVCHRAQ
jgi:catechol 2,3-dioxygenase-like lactoylglutathione lyase family enzyme